MILYKIEAFNILHQIRDSTGYGFNIKVEQYFELLLLSF